MTEQQAEFLHVTGRAVTLQPALVTLDSLTHSPRHIHVQSSLAGLFLTKVTVLEFAPNRILTD